MKIEEITDDNEAQANGADLTAEESLSLGDSYFVDEEFDLAVDAYAAALLVLDEDDGDKKKKGDSNALKIRILSHRSAAFHRMRRDQDAFDDAREALDLMSSSSSSGNGTSSGTAGLRAGESEIMNKRAGVAALNLQSYSDAKVFFEKAQQLATLNRDDEKFYKSYLKQCDYHLKPKTTTPTTPPAGIPGTDILQQASSKPVEKESAAATTATTTTSTKKDEDKKPVAKPAPKVVTNKPPPKKSTPPPPPSNPNKKPVAGMPKYQYYQNDKFVTVSLLESNVKPEDLDVRFEKNHLTVKLVKGGTNYTVIMGNTYSEVNVDQCKINYKGEKVLIKLKKENLNFEWQSLLGKKTFPTPAPAPAPAPAGGETKQDENGDVVKAPSDAAAASESAASDGAAATTTTETTPKVRPYASHKDWDKIEKDLADAEKNEKPEGDEAMNALFKQIYATADEDTRRAMVKSYQTSGGTVLSTNWGEVKEKDYEAERTAPKGMEWKNWEGKKLPTKDDD